MNVPNFDTWVRLDLCHTSQGDNGEPVQNWEEGEPECAGFLQPSAGRIINSASNAENQISQVVVSRYAGRLDPSNASRYRMVEIETGLEYEIKNVAYIQGRKKYIQFLAVHKTSIDNLNV